MKNKIIFGVILVLFIGVIAISINSIFGGKSKEKKGNPEVGTLEYMQNEEASSDEVKVDEEVEPVEEEVAENIDSMCLSDDEISVMDLGNKADSVLKIEDSTVIFDGGKTNNISSITDVFVDFQKSIKSVKIDMTAYDGVDEEYLGITLRKCTSSSGDEFYLDNNGKEVSAELSLTTSAIKLLSKGEKVYPLVTLREDTSQGFEEDDIAEEDLYKDYVITDFSDYESLDGIEGLVLEKDGSIKLDGVTNNTINFCNVCKELSSGDYKIKVSNFYFVRYDEYLIKGRKLAVLKSYYDKQGLDSDDSGDYDPQNGELYIDVTNIKDLKLDGKILNFSTNKVQFIHVENSMLDFMDIAPLFTLSKSDIKLSSY